MNSPFYQYKTKTISGKEISMEDFKGKTILVVNTASKCGLTPQFEGLEKLYKEYKEKGFVILGFPCDQFANQEPGTEDEIQQFCSINYGVTFPMFNKIDVNGENSHDLYNYLKKSLPGFLGGKIKWNFTKFLINSDGIPKKRFAPTVTPDKLTRHIETLLSLE